MKHIILETGQNGYQLILVPDRIAENAFYYQMEFDKWLMDRNNNHGYWCRDQEGNVYLAYDPPAAFVRWLNDYVLSNNEKAEVLEGDIPVLHF